MVVRDHALNIYAYSSRITKISSPPDTNRLCVYKFVYMAHHFILLQLNPFDLRVDRVGW